VQNPNTGLKSTRFNSTFYLNLLIPVFRYPKQQRLLTLKKAAVNQYSLPPSYLPYSSLTSLHPNKFDVILIDPPFNSTFTWDHLQELPIPSLAGDPSFVFLWVGSGAGEGLERGREILAKWGYRRCEDVVWVKTNKTTNQGPGVRFFEPTAQFNNMLISFLADGPPNHFAFDENKTTLFNGYKRYRSTVNGQLVRPL